MSKRTKGNKLKKLTPEYKRKREQRNARRDRARDIAAKREQKTMPDGAPVED